MLSHFSHAAVLTHDPFETRIRQSSPTIQPKWIMYQHPKSNRKEGKRNKREGMEEEEEEEAEKEEAEKEEEESGEGEEEEQQEQEEREG